MENNDESWFCEIRPNFKHKLFVAGFCRPPNSTIDTQKALTKSLQLVSKATFDQLLACWDVSLPTINWKTCTFINNDSICSYFTKLVRDNYLGQLVDSRTRNTIMLDLALTKTVPLAYSSKELIFSKFQVNLYYSCILQEKDNSWLTVEMVRNYPFLK